MKKGIFFYLDLRLLVPALILLFLGLTTLLSISADLFKSQLLFGFISLIVFLFFSQINYKVFQMYAIPIYVMSVVLLFLVLFLGIESRGAVRWFEIAGVRMQFSEIMKPFLLVSLAWFLTRKPLSFKTFFLTFIFLAPVMFLVAKQPDLGNALILGLIAGAVLVVIGFPLLWFLLGFLALALSSPFLWNLMHDYQKQRLLTFLRPADDPLGASYNIMQAIIAVGSGMLAGRGMSQGTQSVLQFLPERHTDFIFATLSEALGLLGAMIVFICFLFLLYRIFYLFTNVNDKSDKIYSAGAFFLLLIQFFVNVGMNLGMVPVVGVTLPFISYGGSSLVSNFILLGILSSISKNLREENVLEIR